jgi:hypothetical protein
MPVQRAATIQEGDRRNAVHKRPSIQNREIAQQ